MRGGLLGCVLMTCICCEWGSMALAMDEPGSSAAPIIIAAAAEDTSPPAAKQAKRPKSKKKEYEYISPTSPKWTSEIRQEPATVTFDENEEIDAPKLLTTIQGPTHGFTVAEFTGPAPHLIICVKQTSITKEWDFFQGRTGKTLLTAQQAMVFEGKVNKTDTFVVLGMNNKTIELTTLPTYANRYLVSGFTEPVVEDLAFSEDGNILAVSASGGNIALRDLITHKQIGVLPNKGSLTALVFNHDGSELAGTTYGGLISTWDVSKRTRLHQFRSQSEFLNCASYIGDTSHLILGDSEGKLRVVDTQTREEVRTINAHQGTVFSLATSADGKMLATGGEDTLVKLWRLADFSLLAELEGHSESVIGVALSRDGRFLAARGGSDDHAIQVWQLPKKRLQSQLEMESQ